MTVEKSNAKFSVHSAGKLPDYDKEIRKTRVTRTRYFDHAVRYINSKDNTEDAKKLVITRLASYPSEAIDGIFHQIDNMLMKAELSISKKQRLLMDAAQIDEDDEKEIVHVVEKVHQDKVEDLYDSIFNEGETAAKEEENTVEPTPVDVDSVENVENPETDSGI